jgi:radical SAM superfamily enzyme YgiQ (UPF0313 family)
MQTLCISIDRSTLPTDAKLRRRCHSVLGRTQAKLLKGFALPGSDVLLINANEMRPPVAPLALDYIGGCLTQANIDVQLLDLSFVDDSREAVTAVLRNVDPLLVGISFRNTDDCFWPSAAYFVPQLRELVTTVRSATTAPIVLGGCGFNIFPLPLVELTGADLGVVGDGEDTMLRLVEHLQSGKDHRGLPGIVFRSEDGKLRLNAPQYVQGDLNVPPERLLIDNVRYLREGGMGNVETKRGCPMPCIYCADPLARGNVLRCRQPQQVADEMEALLRQGVDVLHLCDGEFNIPPEHALAVCEEMIRHQLGERIHWYCYATVHPFPAELATAMRRAGCVGINFGADSACDHMLAALKRGYQRQAIAEAVRHCKQAGITVMLDLLLGGPGETRDSVAETIAYIKQVDPDRCGAATGVRLYPGTPLARMLQQQGPLSENPNLYGSLEDNDHLLKPVFYIDHALGEDAGGLVCDLIAGDERFFPPPRLQGADNYNYNDNTTLERAIADGHRGAFWDILRQLH